MHLGERKIDARDARLTRRRRSGFRLGDVPARSYPRLSFLSSIFHARPSRIPSAERGKLISRPPFLPLCIAALSITRRGLDSEISSYIDREARSAEEVVSA